MKKIIAWPFVTLLTLFVLSFTLSNRQEIELGLFPLPIEITVPVFLPIVVALLLGLWAGLVIGWWRGRPQRQKLRAERKSNKTMSRDLEQLQQRLAVPDAAPSSAPLLKVPSDDHAA